MKVTIIHKPGCPLCELAIREFSIPGNKVEEYGDIFEIVDEWRRNAMMTDLILAGGDKNAFPQVFIDDRFVPWQPNDKKGA